MNRTESNDLLLRYGYPQRIVLFFCITFVCLIIAGIAMGIITKFGVNTLSLRISTVIQDVVLFVFPAVATAVMVSQNPARLLAVDREFDLRLMVMVILTMIVSLPAMNALVAWNESLTLPESLSGLEQWMRESEESAQGSVKLLLGGTSIGDLVVSILIVGVLAGVSEELFFRGALQRLMASGPMNKHIAIWLTAFIFSAFHVQFFGFFPRLLLGAYFGYLLLWSRSVWLPIVAHVLNNGSVVYASWLERTSGDDKGAKLDSFGVDSVWLILLSVILVAICIAVIRRISQK